MDPLIDDFIKTKKIAVIGMSRSGKKFGNMVAKELKMKGYIVFPVHPEATEIDGFQCIPDLKSLEGNVEAVWISIPPPNVKAVLHDAAEIGLKNIWIQQGAWSEEVQETIHQLNLNVIKKKCILMYAQPVKSFHKFHRTVKSIFGGI